jgi:hypothetical protein
MLLDCDEVGCIFRFRQGLSQQRRYCIIERRRDLGHSLINKAASYSKHGDCCAWLDFVIRSAKTLHLLRDRIARSLDAALVRHRQRAAERIEGESTRRDPEECDREQTSTNRELHP